MFWKKLKAWQKGLIVGATPLILTIIATLVFIITIFPPESTYELLHLLVLLSIFYIFSFIFLILAILIGIVFRKSWKVKTLTFLIVVLVFVSLVFHGFSGEPPSGEAKIYKGIWSPAFPYTAKMLSFDIEQLREDGVNTLSFGPNYDTDSEGRIQGVPLMKELTILFIQTAHRNGFRVFLVPNLWGPDLSIEKIDSDLFFKQSTKINLEWAEIAERYGVEMYAPSNEPSMVIPNKEAVNKWTHDVAIKVREKYHGILVYKAAIADWGFDNDYRGYDYVGLDLFPYNQTLDEWRRDVRFHLERGLEFAERDGAKGVIFSEIGVQVGQLEGLVSTTKTPFSLDYQKEAYKIFFEEGRDKVSGFVFCCWDGSALGPNGYPAEQIMKEWFQRD